MKPKHILLFISAIFAFIVLFMPVWAIFSKAFSKGIAVYIENIMQPDTLSAIWLTMRTALIVLPINIVFGVCSAWLISKYEFRGKRVLITIIEMPFAISPIIAGLAYLMLYGNYGIIGAWLEPFGIQLMFNTTGITLISIFVTCPFIARILIPLMTQQGSSREEASLTLGANGFQTFMRITLPQIKWAMLYGAILANARAMGEFGAVSVVSGLIRGETMTLPTQVQLLYLDNNTVGAFAVATLLSLLAVITLILRTYLEKKSKA